MLRAVIGFALPRAPFVGDVATSVSIKESRWKFRRRSK